MLIEKPLGTNLAGLSALASTVCERQLIAAVAYVYRAYPALAAMRGALQSGRFGRPVQLVANCGQNFPTYRPAYQETYYTDRAKGGGAIQDALTHVLNAGEWLVGPIDRLVVDAAHQVLGGTDVEDTVHVIARHGGVLANYSLNQHQPANEITLTVICEQGILRWEPHLHRWRWMVVPDRPWQEERQEPLERDTPFLLQAHNFLDAIEKKTAPLCTLEEGCQTLHVNLAALASLEQKCWQTVEAKA
jgi:predicted dehydrogenase